VLEEYAVLYELAQISIVSRDGKLLTSRRTLAVLLRRIWIAGALTTWCIGAALAVSAEPLLQPFSHTYVVTANRKGKSFVVSHWNDKLDSINVGGKQAYRRTQISTQVNGKVRTWISVFNPQTLAPIADTFDSSDGEIFARVFNGGRVTSYSSSGQAQGIMSTSTTEVPAHYSDFNGGQFGLALLLLPLSSRYTTTLTSFAPNGEELQSVPIAVQKKEKLTYGTCSYDAYVVRASFLAKDYPDEEDNFMTFWVTKKPPYIVKLVTDAPKIDLTVTYELDDKSRTC
jgi:hypothetical protein